MKRYQCRVLGGLVVALGWWLAVPVGWAENKKSDLLYARHEGRNLYLDIFYPTKPPPSAGYPLIICFHGGGWAWGNKKRDLFLMDLTKQGFAVASVQYRLSPQAEYPAQMQDIRAAAYWLRDHATDLKLDPDRFGAAGASAGAHLALLLAFSQNRTFPDTAKLPSDLIKAVCALYPPTDLVSIIPEKRRNRLDNLVSFLLAGTINDRIDNAREASPINYVKASSPPVFFVHGDKDSLVPMEQSLTMLHALRRQGVEAILVVYQGGTHGFRPKDRTISQIEQFFRRNLKVTQ